MDKTRIARQLKDLEQQLLEPEARKSDTVLTLLADEFMEFGSSGRQYTKAEIVAVLHAEEPVEITASHFEVKLLSTEIALVTYRAQRQGNPPVNTLRSSIWQRRDDHWQIVFHQGTRID